MNKSPASSDNSRRGLFSCVIFVLAVVLFSFSFGCFLPGASFQHFRMNLFRLGGEGGAFWGCIVGCLIAGAGLITGLRAITGCVADCRLAFLGISLNACLFVFGAVAILGVTFGLLRMYPWQ
jgi:hypothetical protein